MTADKPSPLVPKLRFPEFTERGPWVAKQLDDLCDRLSETVGDSQLTPVSISAGKGFVPQAEKFGRDISGSQYSKYIWLRRGDFAYNRGNSRRFPQGCVYQLTEFDEAAASNAFHCFRLHDRFEPAFVLGFFEDNGHGRQLIRHITSGARSNGLLNISADTFFGILVPVPPTATEQQKIADCLGSLDDLIAAECRKLEALRQHKQGLMQQLFPQPGETVPRLRFSEFRDGPEWKLAKASEYVDVLQGYGFPDRLQGKRDGEFPFYKVSDISAAVDAGEVFLGDANNHVDGDVVAELRAKPIPVGTTVFAKIGEAIRSNKRAVTTRLCLIDNNAAGVKAIEGAARDRFVYYLWSMVPLIEYAGGVVPAVNKSVIEQIPVCVPEPIEQQKIADCLDSLDALIAAQSWKLDGLRTHKKGLMQQLFPSLEAPEA